jgi:hypothetical protein
VICYLDDAARVLEKCPVPTVWLHAPGSDEGAVFHHDNPDADEVVLAGSGPDTQSFAIPEKSHHREIVASLSFAHSSGGLLLRRGHASFASASQGHR